MANLSHIAIGILILQMYVNAAPSDVSKPEDIAKLEQVNPKLDSEPKEIQIQIENQSNSTETQRQKRWYNPYGYGFPPINPLIYPNFNNRDEGPSNGFYGGEDPFVQIHRRIQEIANAVRQPLPPPPLPHLPLFFPVLFVPSGDCNCNENPLPDVDNNSSPHNITPPDNNSDNITSTDNTTTTPDNNSDTTPTISSRWPEMEDNRQNWGFLINESESSLKQNFNRPISFDPIKPKRPTRPTLPVEHGSIQSDSNDRQRPPQTTIPSAPETTASNMPQNEPSAGPPNMLPARLEPPSACDSAILTCCHQAQIVYDCFEIQGCPNITSYGNPCYSKLILRVIEKFQSFYGQRAG